MKIDLNKVLEEPFHWEETAAVEVCGKGGECSEGYYCQCRLACFLCEAFGGDFCGTCKLEA